MKRPAATTIATAIATTIATAIATATLKGKAGMVSALLSTHGPEDLIDELARGMQMARGNADVALHLFAFGGAQDTARWLAESGAAQVSLR